jgi:gliding motility-associated-like protein
MSSTDPTPEYTFSNKVPDTYEVCLIASDAHDCTDTICHDVIIDDVLFTYVPNAFTPDGDGENEQWRMSSNIPDMMGFELRVFDRWGQLVFEANDPYKAWNGTFKNSGGDILKQDVYAYRIVYQIASTGGVREELGHVTLLK